MFVVKRDTGAWHSRFSVRVKRGTALNPAHGRPGTRTSSSQPALPFGETLPSVEPG